MNDKKYEVRFLPRFEDDLYSIVSYIAEHLKNPAAEYVAEFLEILQHCRIKEDIGYIMFSNIGLRHATCNHEPQRLYFTAFRRK